MIRDPDRLTERTFDVLVLGGGIYGLTIAYDAAQRGLSVALIERDDFGSGASFNHLRTIHGGLRYLQTLDLARARESVRERRTIARIAPHAVKPLPFALPVYRSLVRGTLAYRAAFLIDRFVGAGRNRSLPRSHHLPPGGVLSRGAAIERFPGLRRQRLTGAAVWHDYVTLEPDRLTLTWAIAAAQHGAVLANHMEGTEAIPSGDRIVGVRARDLTNNQQIEITARVTVNATGAHVDQLLRPLGISARLPMVETMNLVTSRDAGGEALGGFAASGRALFMVPWRGRALFGTWEADRIRQAIDSETIERDIAGFITDLNQAFPALDLTRADVTLVHRGRVPASVRDHKVSPERHEQIRDHAIDGFKGLLTVAGTKYTTARAVAERVTDAILAMLERPPIPCRTATTRLPGGSIHDPGLALAEARREDDEGFPSDTIPHLIAGYGSRYREVVQLAASQPVWRSAVAPGLPVIGAELVLAARTEMVVTLADAIIRRTPIGALGYPGDDAVSRAADIVGRELRWSDDRKQQEIAAVKAFYGSVNALKT